jgi:hypothetical protein
MIPLLSKTKRDLKKQKGPQEKYDGTMLLSATPNFYLST